MESISINPEELPFYRIAQYKGHVSKVDICVHTASSRAAGEVFAEKISQ